MSLLPPKTPWILLALLCLVHYSVQEAILGERALKPLAEDSLAKLLTTPDPIKAVDLSDPKSHLSRILIPRAPDTANNTLVRNYLVSTLKALNWHVELDEFEDNTPIGRKKFANVIATKDPKASRKLVLSAHFDSKYFPTAPANQFVGATDSAAPCAMMLDVAEALNPFFEERLKLMNSGHLDEDDDINDLTLQLVFFDGEEAFENWTSTDSIYGARHLAHKWATTYVQTLDKRRLMSDATTELSTIEHLILLDLLGAKRPSIRSYFAQTGWLFDALAAAEKRLGDAGAFEFGGDASMAPGKWSSFFRERAKEFGFMGHIGDDHVPFLQRGVSILHVIAEPFPHVWHKLSDDASALDLPTMRRWNLVLRVFIAEYFAFNPQGAKPRQVDDGEGDEFLVSRSMADL